MLMVWFRNGVQADVIKYIVNMDIGGQTNAQTLHDTAAWDDLPYKFVDNPHQLIPSLSDLVTQLLSTFVTACDPGQGD